MQKWDYAAIAAQVSRIEAGCRLLQPASLVLPLCALAMMEARSSWSDENGDALTDSEYDIVEAWIAGAYLDLTTLGECEEETVRPFALLTRREESGTNGGSVALGWNTVPVTSVDYDPEELISTLDADNIKVATTGLYHVKASVALVTTGYCILALHRNSTPVGYVTQGTENAAANHVAHLDDVVELEADVWYRLLLYASVARTNTGLGVARSQGLYEHYVTWEIEFIEAT